MTIDPGPTATAVATATAACYPSGVYILYFRTTADVTGQVEVAATAQVTLSDTDAFAFCCGGWRSRLALDITLRPFGFIRKLR